MRATISFSIILFLAALLSGCSKNEQPPSMSPAPLPEDDFLEYIILKGEQYSDKNVPVLTEYDELNFIAKFDSSAIYKTTDPANQADINKLYGFSDNNAAHQDFSARFGWNWLNDSLHLYAYIYNNSVRISKELGTVSIGSENSCSIKVSDSIYIFKLNNKVQTMTRASTGIKAQGYKLYPYFGGNETAPHDIHIWIDEQ